ncbi:hypothetical protein [Streptomyces sp. NPDC001770]
MSTYSVERGVITHNVVRLFVFTAAGPVQAAAFGRHSAWWPLTEVALLEHRVFPRELGTFLTGYVEGWIPDGWITLDR